MTGSGMQSVFLANRAALQRFLRARGCGDAVDDLLQELWLKLGSVDTGPIANPLGYLFRMADNLVLDHNRSDRRRARRDEVWTETAGSAVRGVSDQPSAEAALLARERLRIVAAAIEATGERTAAIFRRYRIDGIGQAEIAREMGISLSAVEKHLQKAYRALVAVRETLDAEMASPQRPHIEERR